jgi:hypothetical protein
MRKIVSKRGKKSEPTPDKSPNWPFPTGTGGHPPRVRINPDGTWSFPDAEDAEEVLKRTTKGVDITHKQPEND